MRAVRISQKFYSKDDLDNPGDDLMDTLWLLLRIPVLRLAEIELLVFFAAFLLIFLEGFGAYRRRCNNGKFRLILWTAYTTPPFLITYALGLMQASLFRKEVFVIWSIFLMILFVGADSFSAYNLQDNEQWKRYNWQLVIKALGLGFLIISYVDASTSTFARCFLYIVVMVKIIERSRASMLASKAILQKNSKLVVDYTMREHRKSNQDEVDLPSMKGYTYLVRGEEEEEVEREQSLTFVQRLFIKLCPAQSKAVEAEAPKYHVPIKLESQVITVEKVWQCQGKLLRARDKDNRIKDLCLSFALFKILSLRFVGYSMPQEVYQKSWKLFQMIIQDGYERAFRIVEVELAFVFYQFYTKYQFMFQPRRWVVKVMKLGFFSAGSCAVAYLLWHMGVGFYNIDEVAVAVAVIIAIVILEILQLILMIFSEWGKVVLICNYVKRDSWQKCKCIEKLIQFTCHIEILKPWERKLHQYSLLKSYKYCPSLLLYNGTTRLFIDQIKEGQKQSTPVKLSTEVKSAVISSLLNKGTKLENGKTSLIRNNMPKEEYFWACDLETQAQVIMVWHIATSMCEFEFPANKQSQSDIPKNFKIATNLSRYLAYLVAFAPRLLPDHPYVAEFVFDQVIIEARKTFKKCTSLEERIKELKDKCSREGGESVIDRGARLGKQLLDVKEPGIVWKVLADFWAELMLYVAPSDDMDAHVEKLTTGGEFITQIWALLLHSGIGRDPPSTPELGRS